MIRVLHGDCRDVLPTLAAGSVHTVVTSPPYYGLRDYGVVGQIGLEAAPDEYLATMVAVLREVRRVLRDDGTCWVNMGDSYSSGGRSSYGTWQPNSKQATHTAIKDAPRPAMPEGTKPKDLLMMPARLAIALQADGWWLRSDIIWHKPNPMPESVTDRPTSAHEHVFLLTKQPRYFYDASAVAEEAIHAGRVVDYDGTQKNCLSGDAVNDMRTRIARPVEVGATRSLRNVWTIATHAYPEAHFATFPPALAERCIKAGTSERGCCVACGAPWVRQTDTSYERNRHGHSGRTDASGSNGWDGGSYPNLRKLSTTTGWSPSCECNAPTQLCTVLDPFAGAGTTMLVADRLQRHAIGIELNETYAVMSRNRIYTDAPLLAEVAD